MFNQDGLYLFRSQDDRVLVIIREEDGATLKLREFVNVKYALDAIEDDILEGHDRQAIEEELKRHNSYFTSEDNPPDENLALSVYERTKL